MTETVIYLDKKEYEEAVKQYGQNPTAIRVTNTILGKVKTKMIFKLKDK